MTNTLADRLEQAENCYLLLKRGLYYRPKSCGYTGVKRDAGRYPKSMADLRSGVAAIHEDDAPIYAPATFADIAAADFSAKVLELAPENTELSKTAYALVELLTGFPSGDPLSAAAIRARGK